MVKRIRRKKFRAHMKARAIVKIEKILAKIHLGRTHTFADGSEIKVGIGPRGPRIEGLGERGSEAFKFIWKLDAENYGIAYEPEPEPETEPEPAPEPTHSAGVVTRLGEFPVYHYSRLKLVEGSIEDTPARETVETQELVENMRECQCYVPVPSDVIALHRSGSFLCWELNANLFVIDDEGSQSACHIFSDKQLALNVLRGYTGRRAAKQRDGHIKSYNHSRGWLFKVEEILLNHL